MKRMICSGLLSLLLAVLFPGSKVNGKSVETKKINGREFYTCNLNSMPDSHSALKLSALVKAPKMIVFEDSQQAMFGFWRCTISENYIGMFASGARFKLFDHNGKFIRNIGDKGHGPGEYVSIYGACIDEKNGLVYLADMASRRLLSYTIEGKFLGFLNEKKPISKCVLRCDRAGVMQGVSIPFSKEDFQFVVKNGKSEPKFLPPAIQAEARDKNGNFVGFNNEIWGFSNSSLMTYQITCSDTLYAFDASKGKNYPLITARCSDKKYTFYNELPHCFLIDTGRDGGEIWHIDKDRKTLALGCIENDYLFGVKVNYPTFRFQDGYYCEFFESEDLIKALEEREKSGKLSQKELAEIKAIKDKARKATQGVMFLGQVK